MNGLRGFDIIWLYRRKEHQEDSQRDQPSSHPAMYAHESMGFGSAWSAGAEPARNASESPRGCGKQQSSLPGATASTKRHELSETNQTYQKDAINVTNPNDSIDSIDPIDDTGEIDEQTD